MDNYEENTTWGTGRLGGVEVGAVQCPFWDSRQLEFYLPKKVGV